MRKTRGSGDFFHEALSMERRSSHFAASQTILLSWEENSAIYRRLGSVADTDSDCLSVLTDLAIPVGTPVMISRFSFLDFDSGGIVNRLSRLSDRYVIGIELPSLSHTAAPRPRSERWAA
jgi:hypothetical protein